MAMIATVLPRTFEILGARRESIEQEFANANPSMNLDSVANARQFCDFLAACRRVDSEVPYLADVAACELACAEVGRQCHVGIGDATTARSGHLVRRHPATALLRCQYDIRAIFEGDCDGTAPPQRDTALVVSIPTGVPQIFEVPESVFDLLMALQSWTVLTACWEKAPELRMLTTELLNNRLLEVRE
jgi:hypothetical protein